LGRAVYLSGIEKSSARLWEPLQNAHLIEGDRAEDGTGEQGEANDGATPFEEQAISLAEVAAEFAGVEAALHPCFLPAVEKNTPAKISAAEAINPRFPSRVIDSRFNQFCTLNCLARSPKINLTKILGYIFRGQICKNLKQPTVLPLATASKATRGTNLIVANQIDQKGDGVIPRTSF
jgi:hypothetical protein